jgi:hypothetical protein
MKKIGVNDKELLAAEEKSDKKLKKEVNKEQRNFKSKKG